MDCLLSQLEASLICTLEYSGTGGGGLHEIPKKAELSQLGLVWWLGSSCKADISQLELEFGLKLSLEDFTRGGGVVVGGGAEIEI